MDINKKILALCYERNWSVYDLANESLITQSTLASMFNRGTPPKIETLQCLCDAFGITLAQFFLEDEETEILTQKEKELIALFRKLPETKQQALIDLLSR
jgi:transcriptional regulator with XRE-family HTH domain